MREGKVGREKKKEINPSGESIQILKSEIRVSWGMGGFPYSVVPVSVVDSKARTQ